MKWLFSILFIFFCFLVNGQGYTDKKMKLDPIDIEEVRTDSVNNNQINFNIGTTWTFETKDYFISGISTGFKTYTIQDTFFDGIRTKYVIDLEFPDGIDTFYIEDNKMYFWDEHFQEYIMYYDWEEDSSYQIKYYDYSSDTAEYATVIIDNIDYVSFGNDSIKVQYIHILNNLTFSPYYIRIYEGLGAGYYGIKLFLGDGVIDGYEIKKLRCFTNNGTTYKFVPYACDSTWSTVSVENISHPEISVFPNPTRNKIEIRGIQGDMNYELYTMHGRLVQQGRTNNHSIELKNTGMYLLKLRIGGSFIVRKVLKIK